jgi:hypothetical protein
MKTRLLVVAVCLSICVSTSNSQLIGGKHDVSGRTSDRQQRQSLAHDDIELGSGLVEPDDETVDAFSGDDDAGNSGDMTTCEMLFNERQRDGIVGAYVPQCTPDGQFAPVQCHTSIGQCWCVDPTGQQIPGSIRRSPRKPDCSDSRQPPVWTRPPNIPSQRPISVTRHDDVILVDQKTTTRGSDIAVVTPEQDEDADYGESRVALATRSLLNHPGILAAIIGGGVLILLCVILLLMFIVYRMRKKDEGSYALDDEPKKKLTSGKDSNNADIVYTKAPANDREFYA